MNEGSSCSGSESRNKQVNHFRYFWEELSNAFSFFLINWKSYEERIKNKVFHNYKYIQFAVDLKLSCCFFLGFIYVLSTTWKKHSVRRQYKWRSSIMWCLWQVGGIKLLHRLDPVPSFWKIFQYNHSFPLVSYCSLSCTCSHLTTFAWLPELQALICLWALFTSFEWHHPSMLTFLPKLLRIILGGLNFCRQHHQPCPLSSGCTWKKVDAEKQAFRGATWTSDFRRRLLLVVICSDWDTGSTRLSPVQRHSDPRLWTRMENLRQEVVIQSFRPVQSVSLNTSASFESEREQQSQRESDTRHEGHQETGILLSLSQIELRMKKLHNRLLILLKSQEYKQKADQNSNRTPEEGKSVLYIKNCFNQSQSSHESYSISFHIKS